MKPLTPTKHSPKYTRRGIAGLYDSVRQSIVNWIGDRIYYMKDKAAQEKANQYNSKVWLIQQSHFKWVMPRTAEIDWYKTHGLIGKNVNFIELSKIAAKTYLPQKDK